MNSSKSQVIKPESISTNNKALKFLTFASHIHLIIILALGVLVLIAFIFSPQIIDAEVKHITLKLEVVKSEQDKEKGLSGRESMGEDYGMLFVYASDVSNGFWMKDCKFPLDILFLNSEKDVVDIRRDFEPCNSIEVLSCPVYYPTSSYRYVIELNAGFATNNQINNGEKFTFEP